MLPVQPLPVRPGSSAGDVESAVYHVDTTLKEYTQPMADDG